MFFFFNILTVHSGMILYHPKQLRSLTDIVSSDSFIFPLQTCLLQKKLWISDTIDVSLSCSYLKLRITLFVVCKTTNKKKTVFFA